MEIEKFFSLFTPEIRARKRVLEGGRMLGRGDFGGGDDDNGDDFTEAELETTKNWLSSRAVTIYGGTNEVQMNIIAKRVLGLPD